MALSPLLQDEKGLLFVHQPPEDLLVFHLHLPDIFVLADDPLESKPVPHLRRNSLNQKMYIAL